MSPEAAERSILSMRDISVEFPGVRALSHVNISVESGRIYALAGANGAGKSTLMKVLSGVNTHYTGSISIDGEERTIASPGAAKELGIEVVYQEVDTALFSSLSAAENIMINFLTNKLKNRPVNWKYIRATAREALVRLGVEMDVKRPAADLSLAEKQMVLAARAVRERCKFLILDDPTAPLSRRETENLFAILRRLAKEEQVGIVFISHRLAELFEICEHIIIMRDGRVAADMEIEPELTIERVVEYMLGRGIGGTARNGRAPPGEVLLELEELSGAGGRVRDISLELRSGEIAGIAGLVGAGKSELCKTIFGAYRGSGAVKLKGRDITPKTPAQAVARGLALVPEERRKEGIFVNEPVYINITIAALGKFLSRIGFVQKKRQIDGARKIIGGLGIKTRSEYQSAVLLSGGNQQKVVVGKWLATDAEVYIFDEPTKGVDVGAKEDVYRLIENLAARGKGIIYASCEFSELLAIANRVYVMFDGRIVKELAASKTDEKELLYYAAGGN
jgi:simple sugar transport system ATP-binding protein